MWYALCVELVRRLGRFRRFPSSFSLVHHECVGSKIRCPSCCSQSCDRMYNSVTDLSDSAEEDGPSDAPAIPASQPKPHVPIPKALPGQKPKLAKAKDGQGVLLEFGMLSDFPPKVQIHISTKIRWNPLLSPPKVLCVYIYIYMFTL